MELKDLFPVGFCTDEIFEPDPEMDEACKEEDEEKKRKIRKKKIDPNFLFVPNEYCFHPRTPAVQRKHGGKVKSHSSVGSFFG